MPEQAAYSGVVEMLSVLGHKALGPGIFENIVVFGVGLQIVGKLPGVPLGHLQVVHQVVAAVDGSGAGDLCGVLHGPEGTQQQIIQLPGRAPALEDQVKAGETAHGTPVDHLVLPIRVVAEEGGNDVLQGVHGAHVDDRLPVGALEADVIGGHGIVAQGIYPAGENAGDDAGMIYRKALNEFHVGFSFVVMFSNDDTIRPKDLWYHSSCFRLRASGEKNGVKSDIICAYYTIE